MQRDVLRNRKSLHFGIASRYACDVTRRRVFALLTGVLLLQLNLIASDLVCARHHESSTSSGAMTQHGAMPVAQSNAVTDVGHERCQTPSRAGCCVAMGSCGLNLGFSGERPDGPPAIARLTIATGAVPWRSSFAPAPDPPPPKA
jgi:hypothetical protein